MNKSLIPYGKHSVDESDIESVSEILRNKFLTQGETVPLFEQRLCEYTGAAYAVAVNSGTSGLHIACMAADVQQGDIVWTVPNSFVASANCALYCQATIDFVDIDPVSRNLCVRALTQKLAEASRLNKLPKALIVVHFAGISCDMQVIRELTKPYDIILIEDAAHALGANYQGRKVGAGQFSDMSVLSFHPVKSITTAEGGAVLCNDAHLHQKLVLAAKHGVTRDPALMQGESEGPWYYQQVSLGYNYRLSDIHAALGISQLNRLDQFVAKRQTLADTYYNALRGLPIRQPEVPDFATSAWHLFMIEVPVNERAAIYSALHQKGVGVNVHYIPIHLQPYYRKMGFSEGDFPNAEHFYAGALTLPLFPDMTADEQTSVIAAVKEVVS